MTITLLGPYQGSGSRSTDLFGDFRRGSRLSLQRGAERAEGGVQEAPR